MCVCVCVCVCTLPQGFPPNRNCEIKLQWLFSPRPTSVPTGKMGCNVLGLVCVGDYAVCVCVAMCLNGIVCICSWQGLCVGLFWTLAYLIVCLAKWGCLYLVSPVSLSIAYFHEHFRFFWTPCLVGHDTQSYSLQENIYISILYFLYLYCI